MELGAVREKFADERRSRIIHDPGDLNVEDLIEDEEMVLSLIHI